MDPSSIRAAVAARPDTAAYAAALAAQEAGKPSSVVAGILKAYAAEWRSIK